MKKLLSKNEVENLVRRYVETKGNMKKIAKEFGMTENAVRVRLSRCGVSVKMFKSMAGNVDYKVRHAIATAVSNNWGTTGSVDNMPKRDVVKTVTLNVVGAIDGHVLVSGKSSGRYYAIDIKDVTN